MRICHLSPVVIFWLGPDKTAPLGFSCCCGTSMDSECPIENVQPTLDDGATPSAEACDRRAATARSRAFESTEGRERRLARDRARRRALLASETAEERERRLSQRRVRDRARRAASRPSAPSETRREQKRSTERQRRAVESQDQRETRLTRYRLSQQRRLEAEAPEERETRLAQARLSQQRRLEAETPEERAARLQDLRARQQETIASETPEETAARYQCDREAHSHRAPPVSTQPLLHQPSVHVRMKKFHSKLASLELSTCTTCLERFPGMTTSRLLLALCASAAIATHTVPRPTPGRTTCTLCYILNQDEVRESVIHMSYVCNVQPHVYIAQIRPTETNIYTATTHAHSHVRVSHFYAYTSTTSWVAPARHKCSAFS